MTWTKLTEDKATWPEDGSWCWVVYEANNAPSRNPYEFYCGGFVLFSKPDGKPVHATSRFSHWTPATPPPFEVTE